MQTMTGADNPLIDVQEALSGLKRGLKYESRQCTMPGRR
jgi:hypothetical protein